MPAWWLADTFLACHAMTGIGVLFNGWPDGASLSRQPQKLIRIMRVCRDEVEQWLKEKRG